MQRIVGRYNTAVVFTDKLEASAAEQIRVLCDQEFVRGSKIRIMPDVHAGAGCAIGTTMTIGAKLVPNLVGVDIGCGLEVAKLASADLDLSSLDRLIKSSIPAGFKVRRQQHRFAAQIDLSRLRCKNQVNIDRARLSIGSLGGGNHFIELNQDSKGALYLVVHSGSRQLGHQVASLYQRAGYAELRGKSDVPRALAYVTGRLFADYLHDMQIAQKFADLNRRAIVEVILSGMGLKVKERFTTIHNYIDLETMILRKGAVAAEKGEMLAIPINMRDGSLICRGKGNPDWNFSAPHGAGRLLSRTEARKTLAMSEYRASMAGVYTSSVSKATLDESPFAYKPIAEIRDSITASVEVIDVLKPLYNFKAAD